MYASDLKHTNRSLEDKLNQLYHLDRNKDIDLSFRPPYLALLDAFGNPHHHLPPVIHVAGTNGKGSTIAFLKSIFETTGYKVHAYTSPHLMKMNERIYLTGQDISDDALEDLIDETLAHNTDKNITFFEATTAMAFAAMARTPADIALIEVGLGGRLDCTNVIENPVLSIITHIGYDHMEFLGDTLTKIAAEKAGIIKPGVPCIIGQQSKDAIKHGVLDAVQYRAAQLKASLKICEDTVTEFELPLIGAHQKQNAALAEGAVRVLEEQFQISETSIKNGLKKASWRARLQDLSSEFQAPGGWEIYLDGGHNVSASLTLADQIQTWQTEDEKDVHLVLGMMAHKDPSSYLEPLLPVIKTLSLVPIPGEPQAMPPETIQEQFPDQTLQSYDSVETALHNIMKDEAGGRVIIAGSLYLAGTVLQNLHNNAHNRP